MLSRIKQRGDRWYFEYYVDGGKRKRVTFNSKKEAEAGARKLMDESFEKRYPQTEDEKEQ